MQERKQALILFGSRLFYVFLLCAVFYLCLGGQLPLREMASLHLFILAVLSAGISAVDSLKGRNYFYGGIALLAVCALVVWGGRAAAGDGGWSGGGFFGELLCLMAIVLGIYLCHLLAEKFVRLKYIAAILLLGGLVAAMVCRWQVPHLGVSAVLLYAASVAAEYIESGWKKQKQGSEKAYLLWLLPFLAGYFVLMTAMPYKDAPYDWAFFVKVFDRVGEKVVALTENLIHLGNEDFGLSTTGFSDESGFFGNLGRRDKPVMLLDNSNRYGGALYLTGKIYDSFDGRQWVQNVPGGERDGRLDDLMTLSAVYGYDGDYDGDYLKERTIGVQYRYFHTKYLFAPIKTCKIRTADAGTEFMQQGGNIQFAKKRGYGTGYRVSYYQMNLGSPVFTEMVLAGGGLPGQEAFERAAQRLPVSDEQITRQELEEYQRRVKKDYLGEVELSPEAELFLRNALAGADADYEKLLRLESALSSLSYNERPGRLPEEVDSQEKFLDYFLVDSREGYCSYFASAFVLLARKEGIPARYVQGFVVPLSGEGSVTVMESMAHAWAEAWLDGVGWIPFEPTPGFRNKVIWEPHRKQEVLEETEKAEAVSEKEENVSAIPEAEPEEDPEALLREEERQRRREIFRFLGYFLLLLLAFAILLFLVDALLEGRRAAKRTPGESFRVEALRSLQILAALGYRRQPSETLSELKSRVEQGGVQSGGAGETLKRGASERIEGSDIRDIEDFISGCEEVLYGGRVVDKETIARLRLARERFLERLKEKKGKAYVLSRIGLYLTRAR